MKLEELVKDQRRKLQEVIELISSGRPHLAYQEALLLDMSLMNHVVTARQIDFILENIPEEGE